MLPFLFFLIIFLLFWFPSTPAHRERATDSQRSVAPRSLHCTHIERGGKRKRGSTKSVWLIAAISLLSIQGGLCSELGSESCVCMLTWCVLIARNSNQIALTFRINVGFTVSAANVTIYLYFRFIHFFSIFNPQRERGNRMGRWDGVLVI